MNIRLKYAIDHFENNPKMKAILLKIAELKEETQEAMLDLIASGALSEQEKSP